MAAATTTAAWMAATAEPVSFGGYTDAALGEAYRGTVCVLGMEEIMSREADERVSSWWAMVDSGGRTTPEMQHELGVLSDRAFQYAYEMHMSRNRLAAIEAEMERRDRIHARSIAMDLSFAPAA